jgi:beta-glucosidase/6-phospho-beta-glucosidase/beta-galactosidase
VDVYITEIGWSDDGQLDDADRVQYYRDHMKEAQTALMIDRCNVKSFTFWSLIDNFEWMRGYT